MHRLSRGPRLRGGFARLRRRLSRFRRGLAVLVARRRIGVMMVMMMGTTAEQERRGRQRRCGSGPQDPRQMDFPFLHDYLSIVFRNQYRNARRHSAVVRQYTRNIVISNPDAADTASREG